MKTLRKDMENMPDHGRKPFNVAQIVVDLSRINATRIKRYRGYVALALKDDKNVLKKLSHDKADEVEKHVVQMLLKERCVSKSSERWQSR